MIASKVMTLKQFSIKFRDAAVEEDSKEYLI